MKNNNMYSIDINTNFNLLELKNNSTNSCAKVSLNEGASLQKLMFEGIYLIKKQSSFEYQNSYASSVLFPFANRINQGNYTFNNEKFSLTCNESHKNALHGLIYNKKFTLLDKKITLESCSVTVFYTEKKGASGFPYKYSVFLTYELSESNLKLSVNIKNEDVKNFPYTLGWHPYFLSDDLQKSTLIFDACRHVVFDENLITKELKKHQSEGVFAIENKSLDACFQLKNNTLQFSTPSYQIELKSSRKDTFLQLYTPKNLPLIAIEPMTGISDSFNNKIGLQVLKPNEADQISWNVAFSKK